MSNIATRIGKLEKAVGAGRGRKVFFMVESVHHPSPDGTVPALPESAADWITAQAQLAAQTDMPLALIWVCPELERAAQAQAQGIPYEIDESRVVRPPRVPA